jgi:phosphoribosyl 1,2-cyclic phosphodiesterase
MDDTITFHGVRGSIAAPGPRTARVGGNTSCVELRLGGERIMLDGGTGLRCAGQDVSGPFDGWLLFGHLHWDHVQGVPFFGPLYDPLAHLRFVGPPGLADVLGRQMAGPTFPVPFAATGAGRTFQVVRPGETVQLGAVQATMGALRHPGGGVSYRLEHAGRVVVYAVDTEPPADGPDRELCALARHADVLILDAQYLPAEQPRKVGWGHGTWETSARLAAAASVGRLVLTHHDPGREDLAVARLERDARRLFPRTTAAREGRTFVLARGSRDSGARGRRELARFPRSA